MPSLRLETVLIPAALAVALGAFALIGGALAFEHWGHFIPCDLCLPQRGPPVVATLIALWALACAPSAPRASALLLAAAMPVLLIGTGLGLHHAGVEQHWWAGPAACTGTTNPFPVTPGDFAGAVKNTHIVRCDEIAWEMFGVSLAGYNALISLALAVLAGLPLAIIQCEEGR